MTDRRDALSGASSFSGLTALHFGCEGSQRHAQNIGRLARRTDGRLCKAAILKKTISPSGLDSEGCCQALKKHVPFADRREEEPAF